MSEKTEKKEKSPALKRSWFQELKAEFGKITWPGKSQIIRETVAVTVVAVILGLIIVFVDWALKYGLSFIW
ncbi:MAG: preprotein translocase subunit SecE [Eubacterium sp.]|nr:preprotein translocase subunit SecE [Eubacterium sp.]